MTDALFADLGTGPAGFSGYKTWGVNEQGEVVGTSFNQSLITGPTWVGGVTTVRAGGTSVSSVVNTGSIIVSTLPAISVSGDAGLVTLQLSGGWVDQNGTFTQLAASGQDTAAYAIDNDGDVAGAVGSGVGAYGSLSNSEAAVWRNGVVTLLGTLPGDAGSFASMLNDKGQVIGQSSSGAFLWQNGQMTEIAPGAGAEAWWINDQGQVVGIDGNYKAFEWQNGVLTELPGYSGVPVNGYAEAINNEGVIVGKVGGAVVWVNGVYGTLPGINGPSEEAVAINDSDIVVGTSAGGPTVWKNGIPYSLQSFAPAGWTLTNVIGINDQNQVVGEASENGVTHIYEMTLPSVFPTIQIGAETATEAAASGLMTSPVAVTDSVSEVSYYLSALQSMLDHGLLSGITLTDATEQTLRLGTLAENDMGAIDAITSPLTVYLDVEGYSTLAQVVRGSLSHPTIIVLRDIEPANYLFVPTGDGVSFTAQSAVDGTVLYQISHVTEVQVGSITDIVASQTPALPGSVTSAQVTELFAAALDRKPDPDGLAYYENVAATSGASLGTVAQWFLQSPEYTAAHSYAQTALGDQQFVSDLYADLLHRTASLSDTAFYYSNVIAPMLAGLQPGTSAFAAAELKAHAQVLAYVSQSPEFLADVRTTGTATSDAQHWLILI